MYTEPPQKVGGVLGFASSVLGFFLSAEMVSLAPASPEVKHASQLMAINLERLVKKTREWRTDIEKVSYELDAART